ncbi:uncharacterized protein [Clytia hemisphaerica]|uniref:Cnidarian restricted protein n=1 Tax=Clytia hemisphaerica TaxID=252671 RepID=A0A7M5XJG1_9CNID
MRNRNMHNRSWFYGFAFLLCQFLTSQGIKITVREPEKYELGKPAEIKWTIDFERTLYDAESTQLFLNENGARTKIGDNGKSIVLPKNLKDKFFVTVGPYSAILTIKNPLYTDHGLNFTCKAFGTITTPTVGVDIDEKGVVVGDIKGGVTSVCGGFQIENEYILPEADGMSKFPITLCGNPQPNLMYTWNGKTKKAVWKEVSPEKKMYQYQLKFENINRKQCGSKIKFQATGFKPWEHESNLKVSYKPRLAGINAVKEMRFSGQNCTVFKMPKPACQEKYNFFGYDSRKTEIWKSLKYEENEFEDCSAKDLFNDIKFVKVQAISWNNEVGDMSDFVEVEEELIEKEIPSGESSNTTLIVTIVCIVLVIFVVVAIFFVCKKHNRCSSNFVPVFCFCCHDNNKTNENKKLNNDTENTYDLLRKPNNNDNSRQQPTDNEDNKHYVNISNENTPAHYEPGRPTNDNTYESYSAAKNAQKNPDRSVYSELGEGGRTGPRDAPIPQSNYAEARESDALRECLNSPPKDIFDSPNEQDNTYQSLGGNVQNSSYPEQKGSHLLPENYNINTGVPVYNDPKSSIRNNPPTWEKLQRPTAPGATPLQPVNVPKFNR